MKNKLFFSGLALVCFNTYSMQDSFHLEQFPEKNLIEKMARTEEEQNTTGSSKETSHMKFMLLPGPLVRKEDASIVQRFFIYTNPSRIAGAFLPVWGFRGSIDNPIK